MGHEQSKVQPRLPRPSETPKHKDDKRLTVRMPQSLGAQVEYWSSEQGISQNEFASDAVFEKVARCKGDHIADANSETVAVLNQFTDRMAALEYSVNHLTRIVMTAVNSVMLLTRGDNYLLDVARENPNEGAAEDASKAVSEGASDTHV